MADSFVCPVCGARSFNENDIKYGYCGRCHEFTGTQMTIEEALRDFERRLDELERSRRPPD